MLLGSHQAMMTFGWKQDPTTYRNHPPKWLKVGGIIIQKV